MRRGITGGIAVAVAVFALLATGEATSQGAGGTEVLVRSTVRADGSRSFEVVHSRRTDAAPPGSRGPIEHGFVAEAIGARGQVLDARGFSDPHALRAEWPSADDLLRGRMAAQPSTMLRLAFSTDEPIDAIRFSARAPGRLRPLGSAPMSGGAETAEEEPIPEVSLIRDNGSADNRLDLVVVAEGYTDSQRSEFAGDVGGFLDAMFAEQPFREYARYFNVRGLFVPSAESGADHPERVPPVYRDTAFHATYNCQNIQRLICVDTQMVQLALWTTLESIESDIVLVLVNDTEYGGSGGSIAVSSINNFAAEIVLHELGHSFGLLADEYTDQPPTCSLLAEPAAANATREFIRERLKWRHWIEDSTPVPTLEPQSNGVVGAYLGAQYCPVGKWRPTPMSKMRALGFPFEPINSEQLVRRFYSFVSPIDAASPEPGPIGLGTEENRTFTITTTTPAPDTLEVAWLLDGVEIGTGDTLTLASSDLPPGSHELRAVASDRTPLVRLDPAGLLTDTVSWSLTVA